MKKKADIEVCQVSELYVEKETNGIEISSLLFQSTKENRVLISMLLLPTITKFDETIKNNLVLPQLNQAQLSNPTLSARVCFELENNCVLRRVIM